MENPLHIAEPVALARPRGAHRFEAFSPKLTRRMTFYRRALLEQWVLLEADPLAFRKPSEDLKKAHERAIYHLDIKLDNMVLNEQHGKPGTMKFIDTADMVKRQPGEAHSKPKDNISTFFRDRNNSDAVASNKSDDEYGFLMAMVAGRYPEKRKFTALYWVSKTNNPQLYSAFDEFVESHVKPEFKAAVRDFLYDPAIKLLTGSLHDMIDWDAVPPAQITEASSSVP